MLSRVLSVATILTTCVTAAAQQPPAQPVLLADIHGPLPYTSSSNPASFTTVGGVTFFTAVDTTRGRELFRSLGTTRTTTIVADLNPGAEGSDPSVLTAVGQRLFFFADDGTAGRQLWVSDGSAAGTRPVTSVPAGLTGYTGHAVGERFVFFAHDGVSGVEPWVSDGTAAGTFLLADIVAGIGSSHSRVFSATAAVHHDPQGRPVLDFAAESRGDLEWWRSDGTVSGTRRIAVLQTGQGPYILTNAVAIGNGRVVFGTLANGIVSQSAIWSSDGTAAGTAIIANPPSLTLWATTPLAFDGEAYFAGWGGALLFATDGTLAGSRSIAAPSGTVIPSIQTLGEHRGSLWLLGGTSIDHFDLLRVDRGASVAMLSGNLNLRRYGISHPRGGAPRVGDRFAIIVSGRTSVIDVATATVEELEAFGTSVVDIIASSGRFFLAARQTAVGVEPFVSDGTSAGTSLLLDVNTALSHPSLSGSSFPHAFARLRGRVLFGVDATPDHEGLWQTDGTPGGTQLLVEGMRVLGDLVPFGDRLAFRGADDAHGEELWVSDGTAVGTRLVADLLPGASGGMLSEPAAFGHELVFVGTRDGSIPELFISDGASLRSLAAMPADTVLQGPMQRVGERMIGLTSTATNPSIRDLWSTDGTTAARIATLPSDATAGERPEPVVVADRMWFFARNQADELVLYATDGIGTQVFALAAGHADRALGLAAVDGRLFAATSAALFVVDGGGSMPIHVPLPQGARPSAPASAYTAIGGQLVFIAQALSGTQLLSTDGTAAGTRRVDQPSFPPQRNPGLIPAGGRFAFFKVITGSIGTDEFWWTDGSTAGTARYGDFDIRWEIPHVAQRIVPVVRDGRFYLPIVDPSVGIESFVIDVGATVETVGAGCGRGARAPELYAPSVPVLGTRCTLHGRSSAGSAALVMLSPAPLSPTQLPTAGRCAFEVDPAAFITLPAVPITGQRFATAVDIPAVPTLIGLQVTLQALIAPTDAAAGVDLSNGLLLTLGR